MVAVEELAAVGLEVVAGVLVNVLLDVEQEVTDKIFVSNRWLLGDGVEQWRALLVNSGGEQVGEGV